MDLLVDAGGSALWGNRRMICALGRAGIVREKREGDGATPAGRMAMRRVLYRPDREPLPATRLPAQALDPADGWCDAAGDPAYNRPVRMPYPASAETLWREDGLYDLIVILGHNDEPVVPGRGSAIFLHLARAHNAPTEGCIALTRSDLLLVLAEADPSSAVVVRAP
jgi:L,D-peptidoglycan transpeptidase YkuD (ErfK/YbiS/YcfS/YnhG family)